MGKNERFKLFDDHGAFLRSRSPTFYQKSWRFFYDHDRAFNDSCCLFTILIFRATFFSFLKPTFHIFDFLIAHSFIKDQIEIFSFTS